jgi:hypothetical protein
VLVAHRLLSPGSEWHLYGQWFERRALTDLLCVDPENGLQLLRSHLKLQLPGAVVTADQLRPQADRLIAFCGEGLRVRL